MKQDFQQFFRTSLSKADEKRSDTGIESSAIGEVSATVPGLLNSLEEAANSGAKIIPDPVPTLEEKVNVTKSAVTKLSEESTNSTSRSILPFWLSFHKGPKNGKPVEASVASKPFPLLS